MLLFWLVFAGLICENTVNIAATAAVAATYSIVFSTLSPSLRFSKLL